MRSAMRAVFSKASEGVAQTPASIVACADAAATGSAVRVATRLYYNANVAILSNSE